MRSGMCSRGLPPATANSETGRLGRSALWQLGDSTSPYARGQFYRRWTGAGFGAAPGTEPVCASGVEGFASVGLGFSSAVTAFASPFLDFSSVSVISLHKKRRLTFCKLNLQYDSRRNSPAPEGLCHEFPQ